MGRNAHWHITKFDQFGEPVAPSIAITKYKTILGLLVRDFISIKYRSGLEKIMMSGRFLKVRRMPYERT
jgi:hypothetical protein